MRRGSASFQMVSTARSRLVATMPVRATNNGAVFADAVPAAPLDFTPTVEWAWKTCSWYSSTVVSTDWPPHVMIIGQLPSIVLVPTIQVLEMIPILPTCWSYRPHA